jgi:Nitrogenase molybdenum-iron protein, alpha and beta chains
LDVEVMTTFTHDISLEEIALAGKAQVNLLLSHEAGYDFAHQMQATHGIPLGLSDIPLPIGLENTGQWIRALGSLFGKIEKAEQIIARGEEYVTGILRKRGLMMIPRYRNCRIALSSDMTLGVGMLRMLFSELEMIPDLLIFKSSTQQSEKLLDEQLSAMGISPKVVVNADGYQVKEALKSAEVDVIIGSAWEKYIAEELGIKVAFDVFSPTNRISYISEPYMGYEGMVYLLQVFANDWERAFRSKHIEW